MADPKTKSHEVKTTTNNGKVLYKERCESPKLEKQKQMDLSVWALKRKKKLFKTRNRQEKKQDKAGICELSYITN